MSKSISDSPTSASSEATSASASPAAPIPAAEVSTRFQTESNYIEYIKKYLSEGRYINSRQRNMEDQTLLMFAAEKGYKDAVKFLIEQGADKRIKNGSGETAIQIASSDSIIDLLGDTSEQKISAKANLARRREEETTTSIKNYEARAKEAEEIRQREEHATEDAEIRIYHDNMRRYSISPIDQLTLERFKNPAAPGKKTYLEYAISIKNKEHAAFLVKNGCISNMKQAYEAALLMDDPDAIKVALSTKSIDGIDIFKYAISNGLPIEGLIEKCKITYRSFDPTDYLKYAACQQNGLTAINPLIEAGAGADLGTPLRLASEKGHTEIVRELIARGADVNQKGCDLMESVSDYSPLMLAVENGHIDTVKTLLGLGADVNLSNSEGKDALSIAEYSFLSRDIKKQIIDQLQEAAKREAEQKAAEQEAAKREAEQEAARRAAEQEVARREAERLLNQSLETELDKFSEKIKDTPGFLLSEEAGKKLDKICTITKELADKLSKKNKEKLQNTLKNVEKHAPGKWDKFVERIRKFIGIKTQKYDTIIRRNDQKKEVAKLY